MSKMLESPQVAINDFARARRKAALQSVITRLTGEPKELLSYDEVRKKLRAVESNSSYLENIPLSAIVGSVGRYSDFNRLFMPLKDSDRDRWASVKRAMTSMTGVPPIDVYKMGDVYFVKDGNHRVSVARELGFETIEAYVTNVHSSVPLSPDIQADDLIIKSELAHFLEQTGLHKLRPESDLSVSVPGQFDTLLEHISVHRYYMGIDENREIAYDEAVAHWFDHIYLPVTKLITDRGLLEDFPGRTITDLYLWVADNRANLAKELGWDLEADTITQKVAETLRPQLRLELAASEDSKHDLANDILVTISGSEASWQALEQALVVAKKEGARLYALHVIHKQEDLASEQTQALQNRFEQYCRDAGLKGQWAVQLGSVIDVVSERARWVDVVVANLAHPPQSGGILSLSSGFQPFIRRVPRPILAVPNHATSLNKALLAFDGSSKAKIALFAAAYIASSWNIPLGVLSVDEFGKDAQKLLGQARSYLEQRKVEAKYIAKEGNVTQRLFETLKEEESDFLLVGGYEYTALFEPLLGGVLDDILRQSQLPMLICQ